jgi:malate synthase
LLHSYLREKYVLVDGGPMSGALFDFALFSFLDARVLVVRGSDRYFYLPTIESHLEVWLWNDGRGQQPLR